MSNNKKFNKEGGNYATCPKCHTEFMRPGYKISKGHPGFLCPECKDRGYSVVGVVHFIPDCNVNILPAEIMTA